VKNLVAWVLVPKCVVTKSGGSCHFHVKCQPNTYCWCSHFVPLYWSSVCSHLLTYCFQYFVLVLINSLCCVHSCRSWRKFITGKWHAFLHNVTRTDSECSNWLCWLWWMRGVLFVNVCGDTNTVYRPGPSSSLNKLVYVLCQRNE